MTRALRAGTIRGLSTLKNKKTSPRAIGSIREATVIQVDIIHLDGDALSLLDRVRAFVRLGDVIADFAQVERIREVHEPDAGVEIGDPCELVFESVKPAIDRFRLLVRPEASPLVAVLVGRHLPGADRQGRVSLVMSSI